MFIRVKNKSTKDNYKKSVQIVHNFREKGNIIYRLMNIKRDRTPYIIEKF
jgi:hypothetical protein